MYSQLFQFEGNLANSGDAGFGNLEVVDNLPDFTITPQGQGLQLGSVLRFPETSTWHMLLNGSSGFKVRVNTGCTEGVLFACDYDDGPDAQRPIWALYLNVGVTPELKLYSWHPNRTWTTRTVPLPSYDTWHEVLFTVNASSNVRSYVDGVDTGTGSSFYGSTAYWIEFPNKGFYTTKFGVSDFGATGPSNNLPTGTTCTGVDMDWLFSSDNYEGALYQYSHSGSDPVPTGDRPLFVGATATTVMVLPTVIFSTPANETTNTHVASISPALTGPPMTSGGGGPTETRREFWS